MRRIWFALVCAALAAACGDGAPATDAGAADASPFTERPYGLKVPNGYDEATPTPLVMVLHGYGASGFVQSAYFGMLDLVDSEGFLLAYPDGTIDSEGKPFWNATDGCCDFDGSGVDDVGYLTAVLDDVAAFYNVDPKRVYLVGHSNGGFMSYRMACDRAPRIAAIVALAGVTWLDPARCAPTEPVSILHLHGDLDADIDYAGSPTYPSAAVTVELWAGYDGCTGALAPGTDLDLVPQLDGAETRVEETAGCPAGRAVNLWTIEGGGHIPQFGPDLGGTIWGFLQAHPKP